MEFQSKQQSLTKEQPLQNQQPTSPPIPVIPGIRVSGSAQILSPDTRIAMLIWGPGGYGKTALAGSLDALTQKYLGKRTLYITADPGEGGGAATIRKLNVPIVTPRDYSELYKILGLLANDREYGGVVVDPISALASGIGKTAALAYPSRENTATRTAGVATRSDYQVMGELTSQLLHRCIGLTTSEKPEFRKHLVVTSADMTREEDERVTFVGPALPGRMASVAVQMFQQVGGLTIKPQVVDGKRVNQRVLTFQGDGVRAGKDRYDVYPQEIAIRKDPSSPGEDLLTMYEKWWLPAVEAVRQGVGV